MANGEPLRAPIRRLSLPVNKKASAKAPRNCLSAAATASAGDLPLFDLLRDQMRDCFGIRIADKFAAALGQLLTQLAKIFNDAIVNHRDDVGGVRMRIVLSWPTMGRPSGVADADAAPPSGSRSSRVSSARNLPSARRRPRTPWSSVATPAES